MDGHGGTPVAPSQEPLAADFNGIRAKELYKYFEPSSSLLPVFGNKPDTVLTAHAQLVACRLNCDRAVVSFVDRESQYFVAEGLGPEHEQDGDWEDSMWADCTTVAKKGRLCEYTVERKPSSTDKVPYFEVTDLTKDQRFNQLPFITGGPKFRYYCGVPITTRKGINIGSIFAMDRVVRAPVTEKELSFMGRMAHNIMTQLELLKDRADKRRVLNMNMCLAAFVDPEYASRKRKREFSPAKNSKIQFLAKQSLASPAMKYPEDNLDSNTLRRTSAGKEKASGTVLNSTAAQTDPNIKLEDTEHLSTYKRAATLLYESLSLEGGGGVVFLLDSSRGAHNHQSDIVDSAVTPPVPRTHDRRGSISSIMQTPTKFLGRTERESYFSSHPEESSEVLAAALSEPSAESPDTQPFIPLSSSSLTRLIKKHPRGRLFTLDAELMLTSTPSGDENSPTFSERHYRRKSNVHFNPMEDLDMLATHFPSARQIAFVPLWDSISGQWAPCFIFNTAPYRAISRSTDFLYSIAFCNCVGVEISRLATLSADHQKQNFIGSISHELRSPLHGILGSMEFLNDTDCTSFQHSLIDTANSCAVTLLDTISMVLDYSKLNNFERNTSRLSKAKNEHAKSRGQDSLLHPSLNIYGFVDLSVITEEVVEGVATGQEFKDITKYDTADMALPARSKSMRSQAPNKIAVRRADVEIIIDIQPLPSWAFLTQPGAFRRIVMNLFGNALKYTQEGHIKVALDTMERGGGRQPASSDDSTTMVRLRITDTGQGISPQFMRSKLFTPFSQENSLNPGTGLGLSLVKEIINMLGGDITVQSEVGIGTEVTVVLPMARTSPPGSTTTSSTPNSAGGSIDRGKDESITAIRAICKNRVGAHYWRDHPEDSLPQARSAALQTECIKKYFTEWYGFSAVLQWQPSLGADFIVVDEIDLQALLLAQQNETSSQEHPLIVVLCTNASRHASVKAYSTAGTLEFVSLPVGPYKLARALELGLEKAQESISGMHSGRTRLRSQAAIEPIIEKTERVTLSPTNSDELVVNVLQKGDTLAREDSSNAQMAMHSSLSTASSRSDHANSQDRFPFPADAPIDPSILSEIPGVSGSHQNANGLADMPIRSGSKARPPIKRALTATRPELTSHEAITASPMSTVGVITNSKGKVLSPPIGKILTTAVPPKLLLVDDNRVNLRLLQTYMTKRSIPSPNIHLAEDGRSAVSVFQKLYAQTPPCPPHIVFMDLSMPILDGFAATRQIRQIESDAFSKLAPDERPPPALIIALTGLASSRDQSEAFISGFDLYMTKPVSFKEVGRLLDNWTANGGAQSQKLGASPVPYGALTGDTSTVILKDREEARQ